MQLCFFEDEHHARFYPLTLTRPTDDLRIGILTIREKWRRTLNAEITSRISRGQLGGVYESDHIDPGTSCLFINARYLPEAGLVDKVKDITPGSCLQTGQSVIAASVEGDIAQNWINNNKPDFASLFTLESQDFLSIQNLWDLFQLNGIQIKKDLDLMNLSDQNNNGAVSGHAVLVNKKDIFIEQGAKVEAGCVLSAETGPIYIGKDAVVMAGSVVRGPAAVCEGATVKMGAKIYEDTTIGPVCKVGGEVNNSIFHSYSNKGHDGFVGNSIIGQWCNLGAGTNTSNLKNNYSTVRITDWQTRDEVETGQQFFGTVMGDHSKTAINTQLNTGTICGVSCNIFSSDFPPKFIPSFSWVGTNVIQPYKPDKAFETMEAMMVRRDKTMSEEYRGLIKSISEQSRHS